MQTWEYAEAKCRTGPWAVERAILTDSAGTLGAVQALIRRIPLLGRGLVWINRGPLWRRAQDVDIGLLLGMMAELRRHWVDDRGMYLRIVPPVPADQVSRGAFHGVGYQAVSDAEEWASAMLDLSKPEEQLRGELSGNWRKQLNKAERAGVCCIAGTSADLFEEAVRSYKVFVSERKLVTSVTPDLLQELHALLPEERRLWIFQGRQDSEYLGSLIVVPYANTCMYLALAINEAGRARHAGYVMHWTAIATMKQQGYRWFDVGGLGEADTDHSTEGILQFKKGLRGVGYKLCGEIEAHSGDWINEAIRWRLRRARAAANA